MLTRIFNQFNNRRRLKAFEVSDGDNKGYKLTLKIEALEEFPSLRSFRINLEEVPWAGMLYGTKEALVNAHSISRTIEKSFYYKTGKAFGAFIRPEGSKDYYEDNARLLKLATGRHEVLLLPKGASPESWRAQSEVNRTAERSVRPIAQTATRK